MSWTLRWIALTCAGVASLTACLDQRELSLGAHMPRQDAAANMSAPDAGSRDLGERDHDDDDDDVQNEAENGGDFEHDMR